MDKKQETSAKETVVVYPRKNPSCIKKLMTGFQGIKPQIEWAQPEVSSWLKEMDELLLKLLFCQMQGAGLITENKFNEEESKTGISGIYKKWLEESKSVLIRNGLLKDEGKLCVSDDNANLDHDDLWKEWDIRKAQWIKEPTLKAQAEFVETTLKALPEIITGKMPATDMIFPNSSMHLVEAIYKYSKVSEYFNEETANVVSAYVEQRIKDDPEARIRILEIGAGTGGTSAKVFSSLKPFVSHIDEYCYTDISKAFLINAQNKYMKDNKYLKCSLFNVNYHPSSQGIDTDSYDIVIATNVLHATKNIRETLRNAKAVLKNKGLIIINEITGNSLFTHLTFGLLEGWWIYEDKALRIPGCPGLYPKTWKKVLESEGYSPVFFPVQEAHEMGQQIIVAESDGFVRQKENVETSVNKTDMAPKTEEINSSNKEYALKGLMSRKNICVSKDSPDGMCEDFVKETIINKLSESLKVDMEDIDVDESFADYGLDSILAVQLVRVINQTLSIKLETTDLFDYSSVNWLSNYILSRFKNQVDSTKNLNKEDMDISSNVIPDGDKEHACNAGTTLYMEINREVKSRGNTEDEEPSVNTYAFKFRKKFTQAENLYEKQKADHSNSGNREDIAIIGMSGRFAGSQTVEELWKHLENGDNLIEKVSRWDLSKHFPDGKEYCNAGGFLRDIDKFDPLFFNISWLEATYMDPQQRIFMEESWKALEDAGYAGKGIQGLKCGVYVGCSGGDYSRLLGDTPPAQAFWGNASSVVPARIAYYLDLKGPAISIDTACSSSLVAIHLACQGLWTGEQEMALAGGVFVQTTPGYYIVSNRAGMLSPTGISYTFDERADGFVPGEGVGVLVLKRLKEAVTDGDHIYGVIRGTGMNQDGTTNGITAPSAISQESLECSVYDAFDINPENIQMVEAHGTGTKLGDPIEFNALTRAFGKYTDKKEYCAIGSIKTNLGHAANAAGVAGVIKILLSLKHRQIPPSLNFEKGNSNIRFKESPFYVNTTLKAWEPENGEKRCAVVSAFGFSGTNVHMVIEEAPENNRKHLEKPGYLIALSAHTSEQLRKQAEQLVEFCEKESGIDCGNVSYTLLLGRKHFNNRLACVVQNMHELVELLKKWLATGKVSNLYHSEDNKDDNKAQLSLKQYEKQCIENCKNAGSTSEYLECLSEAANLFVQGYVPEFEKLFINDLYSRVSLPTYPFAKERYWVEPADAGNNIESFAGVVPANATAFSHPLVQRNTSNFSAQRFSSTFTGCEFFLRDHMVKGRKVLPGVAYLEMAREAVEQTAEELIKPGTAVRLKNIVWMRPIIVEDKPVRVHIGITLEEDGDMGFEVYSQAGKDSGERLVHSQGSALLIEGLSTPVLDIDALLAKSSMKTVSADWCYETFKRTGLDYGPAHRGIEEIYVGQGEVLAKLSLKESLSDTLEQFILHPGLLDSALQASIAFADGLEEPDRVRLSLPFALEELDVYGRCSSVMWAMVKLRGAIKDSVQKFDIDLCDCNGNICVSMKGFSARSLEDEIQDMNMGSPRSDEDMAFDGNIMFAPLWDNVLIEKGEADLTSLHKTVIIGGTEENGKDLLQFYINADLLDLGSGDTVGTIARKLEERGPVKHIVFIAPDNRPESMADDILISGQKQGVILMFRLIKALLDSGYETLKLEWSIITVGTQSIGKNDRVNPTHASLHGLIGSMAKEYPNWKVRLVDMEDGCRWPIKDILSMPFDSQGNPIAYRCGEWYRQKLVTVRSIHSKQAAYKMGGVYVVIGGAGGIGESWTEYMIRTYKANVVWIGRSEEDEAIRRKVDKLAAFGPAPYYIRADASNYDELKRVYGKIKGMYSHINGIIHSAIVLLDQSLRNMEEERFNAALSAKVDVCVRLAQVFGEEPLDFVMFFSSTQSFSKMPGQSNYASGCTFKDAFAAGLSREWKCAVKVMNWGYWGSVGIVAEESYRKRMEQADIGSIEPSDGMKALETLLSGSVNQIGFIKTLKNCTMEGIDAEDIIMAYPENSSADIQSIGEIIEVAGNPFISSEGADGSLKDKVRDTALRIAARLLEVRPDDVDLDAEFSDYGFDQVILSKFAEELNREFNIELTAAAIADRATIDGLIEYILEDNSKNLFTEGLNAMEEMNRLLLMLLWAQLETVGLKKGKKADWNSIKTGTGLIDLYRGWIYESLWALERNNYIKYDEEGHIQVNTAPADIKSLWEDWDDKKTVWLKNPDISAHTVLAEAAVRALPKILTGKIPATDIIFPDSSMELVQGIYKGNKVADYFNEVVAKAVEAYIKERIEIEPGATVRIIEIGAGTGGTSAVVFSKLKMYRANIKEYCYTDLSKAFLLHAEKEYKPENPYLTCRIFNVERPLLEQGIDAGGYDIVIATNVLHATRNIRQTLQNAKAVLKKNGLILINEISCNTLFSHLTFGLLEGWWLYEDRDLRIPGCPGLYPGTWQKVLEREGFSPIIFPAEKVHDMGQQIVIAQSDGVVRQKCESKSVVIPTWEQESGKVIEKVQAAVPELMAGMVRRGEIDQALLTEKGTAYIKKLVSETLRIPSSKIDSKVPLEKYGIDSILVVQLTGNLRKVFKDISSTLFFECQTIDAVVEHFIKTQRELFISLLGLEDEKAVKSGQSKDVFVAEPRVRTAQRVEITHGLLREKGTAYIKKLVSETLRIPSSRIDSKVPLEKYGIDSILVVQLTGNLRKVFKDISSTLFFECQTIDAVVEHFIKTQKELFISLLGLEDEKTVEDKYGQAKNASVPVPVNIKSAVINSGRFARMNFKGEESSDKTGIKDVAVIGLAGRYPGAENIEEFWDNLKQGKNCITEIPRERWDWEKYYSTEKGKEGSMNTKWGGFVKDVDRFDPLFFRISPAEAEIMDPHERLFLEVAYQSIEDAGYTPSTICGSKRVGVFVGVMNGNYPTGARYWSVANRISYLLNFQGPSMALDTACSSSLTAIHLALESIYSGVSECAIAGGVNIVTDPIHYLRLSTMEMLSPSGMCKAFGDHADGFVDGEGVGAIILKPLKNAVADGDHIYGVIKGSMINAGGKTNGYTVPNPNAQYQLVSDTFKRAGVNASEVSYIEAHGTGTALGDPIEISALTRAFNVDTDKKQFCSIGSVKSNIGHCESASGIAGVTKVLMQLKYRQIVPSLHSRELNPNIDFTKTPFIVQQELGEWKRPVVEKNGIAAEYSRIAGISSFGAGGANAHVIIEEYTDDRADQKESRLTADNPAIILLSARTDDRLKARAKQLLTAIEYLKQSGISLVDVAYTLQLGREDMEKRMAVIVKSYEELKEKLKGFLEECEDIEELYQGQLNNSGEILAELSRDEDLQSMTDMWLSKCKYAKLSEFWVKGLKVDWSKLYTGVKPRRVSLPAYPFAGERYWLSSAETVSKGGTAVIHPLLHQNTSDLSEQRFSSNFTGEEIFFRDHIVKGKKVLPGAVYFEMAIKALEQAAGIRAEGREGVRIKNMAWPKSVVAGDDRTTVHIGLFPGDNGEIAFEVYSLREENEGEALVHSQGSAVPIEIKQDMLLDIKALQDECSKRRFSASECYEAFKQAGIEYGPGHRGIEETYLGEGKILAKLSLPVSPANTFDRYVLHPGMMDSALQASIAFALDSGVVRPALPFALKELDVLKKCTPNMWALLKFSDDNIPGSNKLDMDLCDEQGIICVRMKGFSSRVIKEETSMPEENTSILLDTCWKEKNVTLVNTAFPYTSHIVVLCELDGIPEEGIKAGLNGVRCIKLKCEQTDIEERYVNYTLKMFEVVQGILKEKNNGKILIQVLMSSKGEQQLFTGIYGLLKTAQLENPGIIGQIIEIDREEGLQKVISILKDNIQNPKDSRVRYQSGARYIAGWNEIELPDGEPGIPWKDRGVYLITGGMGGLGFVFAGEIARQVKSPGLILVGRSLPDAGNRNKLSELESLGARVEYRQVDIADKKQVDSLIRGIRKDYGALNGIVHSAGVIQDNFIIKKTKEEFLNVMKPKVAGLINLDSATSELELDLFVLFSSIAGSLGNAGQGDYSSANAFMDNYASYRNNLVKSGLRSGTTLSIGWPLWKEGGMRPDAETEKMMLQMGLNPMETSKGIRAFYRGLYSGRSHIIAVEGDIGEVRRKLFPVGDVYDQASEDSKTNHHIDENRLTPAVGSDSLKDAAENFFKKQVSGVIKLSPNKIDAGAAMETYGIDSIMSIKLVNQLEKIFGSLPKTLFFEYQNIRELTGYFMETYPVQLLNLLGFNDKEATSVKDEDSAERIVPAKRVNVVNRCSRFGYPLKNSVNEDRDALDIAIIGISGRYPKAGNVEEYWRNLRDGVDCITEIPKDRWDYNLYFDKDKDKAGKTYGKWGGFIDGVDLFDPLFFNISPREAEIMDPQERLFLECAYATLEDAGYTREAAGSIKKTGLGGNVGVFVGVMYEEYQLYGAQEMAMGNPAAISGSIATIANRVSYFCNFHGPSIALDTMCSSSLTAIHLACGSLKKGECEMAIAGGVNVSIHPNKYLLLAQGKFMSSKGRCESFGKGGDGYVPGECIGAVLLKPLSKAIADKDHIYGIIKGSALNHGGKTNGYTVPNPNAQAEVIHRAYRESGIDPRTVSYIEAHGTGTSLGDPIEIAGLKKAFEEYTHEKQFCAIGSAKSNIGHCESGAGIAALTKVLMQIKYKQLVPSLHSETLNPYIDFNDTPFVVQQELAEWKRPVVEANGKIKEYPRRAGISSFGAGGANAHLVVEEYIPGTEAKIPEGNSTDKVIIVLSAKSENQLKARVQQLRNVIRERQYYGLSLVDIAYTLQVGREAMDERLAVITDSFEKLEEKLNGFINGSNDIEGLYQGQVKHSKEPLVAFVEDEDLRNAIDIWIMKRKYSNLMELWVKGYNMDWNKLYGEVKPQRVSLPTCPFERERFWVPFADKKSTANIYDLVASASVHPLLHRNISDFMEQRFCSTFTGKEFFLKDHVVEGQRVLPGVAYLEMAREALELATGTHNKENKLICLSNVVWLRPFAVGDQPEELCVGLHPGDNGQISYEFYGRSNDGDTDRKVYSQGMAALGSCMEYPSWDIGELKAQCNRNTVNFGKYYDIYRAVGIDYGPGYRGVDEVYIGEGMLLARLSLPSSYMIQRTGLCCTQAFWIPVHMRILP